MAANDESLKQSAAENKTRLGNPTSLKAESSDTQPGENGRDRPQSTRRVSDSSASQSQGPTGSGTQQKSKKHKTLKEAASENITMLGDHVSMKAETSSNEGTPNKRGATSSDSEKESTKTPIKSKI